MTIYTDTLGLVVGLVRLFLLLSTSESKFPYQENARCSFKKWNNPCLTVGAITLHLKVPSTGGLFNLFHAILSSLSPGKAPDMSKYDRSAKHMCPQKGRDHFIGPSKHEISVQACQCDNEQKKQTDKQYFFLISRPGCRGLNVKPNHTLKM